MKLRWAAWFGDKDVELDVPEGWDVTEARMADAPPASPMAVAKAIRNPIGAPSLRELAAGRKTAAIVVEDITRPLPSAEMLPPIVAELEAAGLRPENIYFIMAKGAHGSMYRPALIAKLGRRIVERHPVVQHNPYDRVDRIGQTALGTPTVINRDFLAADLRISLGAITPHGNAGFGGGAKTVAIGVGGIELLRANHGRSAGPGPWVGRIDGNIFRSELEEIARMADLQFIVNGVVNSRRELVWVFAGDLVQAHRAGVELARKVFATPLPPRADIVVFNAYPKDTDFIQINNSLNGAGRSLEPVLELDGTAVLVTACPQGAGIHHLDDPGMSGKGKVSRERIWPGEHGLIVFSPNLSAPEVHMAYPSDTLVLNRWPQVVKELRRRHGERATVTVYPCSAIQLPA